MAVGITPRTCYEGEDVEWEFTYTDPNAPDLTGMHIELVAKLTAASLNPPLLGPIVCTIIDATHFRAVLKVDVDPGTYVGSARRTTVKSWQMAQFPITVLDSASIDPS